MESFTQRLHEVQKRKQSLLCIGLDVDPRKAPEKFRNSPAGLLEFNRKIIEATSDLVCAYKPNLAFYEALGECGWKLLHETLKYIPRTVLTIGDGKRNDIGNTAERYATSLFDDFGFDAVTINPYMGFDSVEPFLQRTDRGVFLLALTSNAGSKDFQRLKVGATPLYLKVVKKAVKWNTHDNVGLVVGATHPTELRAVRRIAKSLPILIPGVGAQGGDLASAVQNGCARTGDLAIINISRSVLYASTEENFADAARAEAIKVRDSIRSILSK